MKPETAAFLQKAQEFLGKARAMLDAGWPDEAGRAAYLAGFHAAQGFLYERYSKTFKTHGGLQSEFAKLIKDDPRFGVEDRGFLGRAYNLKASADYITGPDATVTVEQAKDAIQQATGFVATVTSILP